MVSLTLPFYYLVLVVGSSGEYAQFSGLTWVDQNSLRNEKNKKTTKENRDGDDRLFRTKAR